MSRDLEPVDPVQLDDRDVRLTEYVGPALADRPDRRRLQLTQDAMPGSGDLPQYLQLSPAMALELEDALRSWREGNRPDLEE